MYHSISGHARQERHNKWRVRPEDFERQMAWFDKHGWKSCALSELVELKNLPSRSFAITFDDGYEDNYIHAFPILRRYGFKATIYLVPDKRTNSWESKNTSTISNLLDKEKIAEMQNSGLIEFGSHTLSHTNLQAVDDETLQQEIALSKQRVEELTGKECKAFAYPYGKYDQRIVQVVKASKYTSAVSVKRGVYVADDDPFTINRIGILGTECFLDFLLKVSRVRNKL